MVLFSFKDTAERTNTFSYSRIQKYTTFQQSIICR